MINRLRLKFAYIVVAILLISLLLPCLGCGTKEEARIQEGNYGEEMIVILEGPWPVESYHQASFEVLGISFDFPVGWGCYTIPEEADEDARERYKGSGDFDNSFIDMYIEQYNDETLRTFIVPESVSLDPNLKLTVDNIAGIKIYKSKIGLDQETGVTRGYIYAVEPKKKIKVTFESSEGRSFAEYSSVLNQLINTLEIDFKKMIMIPVLRPW